MKLNYNLREVARYMGYKHGAEPSEIVRELIDEVYEELSMVITPDYIYKEYALTRTNDGIIIDGCEFKSKKLLNHLKDCSSVILFSATLGREADKLMEEYSETDIAMSAVTQAVGGSLVENLCDVGVEEIKGQIKGEFRPRFSPGYGDLHLSVQRDFFKLLPVKEKLGIQLTESFMMKPTKTVTAFIGVINKLN